MLLTSCPAINLAERNADRCRNQRGALKYCHDEANGIRRIGHAVDVPR
jgi:hypothetical protein